MTDSQGSERNLRALIAEARSAQDGCEDCVLLSQLADALEQVMGERDDWRVEAETQERHVAMFGAERASLRWELKELRQDLEDGEGK